MEVRMKLRELDAHFIKWRLQPASDEDKALNPQFGQDWKQNIFQHVESLVAAHGIMFICPKSIADGHQHHVLVFFTGSPVPPDIGTNKEGKTVRWIPTGTGLDDLTLSPSILSQDTTCQWHGWVKNGDAA
jgi:hypothetical protein